MKINYFFELPTFISYIHILTLYIPAVFASTLPTLFEVGYYSGFLKLILDCLFYKRRDIAFLAKCIKKFFFDLQFFRICLVLGEK